MIQALFRLTLQAARDLLRHPWSQLMTLAAVILVTFLAGLMLLLMHNLSLQVISSQGEVLFQVYWLPETELAQVESQWRGMDSLPFLVDKRTYTPEEALKALAEESPGQVDLDWLAGRSPLPATALLAFKPQDVDIYTFMDETRRQLKQLPGVQDVRFNPLKSRLIQAWTRLSREIAVPLLLFLGVVLALVVGNTLRLSLMRRSREVEIMRLVGAKDWYVRYPLLLESGLIGLAGGILSIIMLKLMQLSLQEALYFPPLLMHIRFLPWKQVLLLMLGPAAAAFLSGYLALRRLNLG